jgi:predicted nucleotidyltransferase
VSTVSSIISDHLDAVRQLCRQYHVARLELFGSAARGEFDPARSDLDFLVDFASLPPADRADAYFGLLAGLQDLFQQEIDLVEVQAVDNPYLKQSMDAARTVLYAT